MIGEGNARIRHLLSDVLSLEPPCMTTVYTDGACTRNPGGRLGSAYIALFPSGNYRAGVAAFESGTSNQAEAYALLMVLEALPSRMPLTIYTDSEYVRTCWERIRTLDTLPKANKALWEALRGPARRPGAVDLLWTRGHVGTPGNELADAMADYAAEHGHHRSFPYPASMPVDEGFQIPGCSLP